MKVRMKKLAALMLAGTLVLSGFTYPTVVNAEETGEVQTEDMTDDTAQKTDKVVEGTTGNGDGNTTETTDDVDAKESTDKTGEAGVTEAPAMVKKPVQAPTAQAASAQEEGEAKVTDKDGNVKYDTFSAALKAATSGSTVQLQKSIVLEKTAVTGSKESGITIDLNGFNIDGTATAGSVDGVIRMKPGYGWKPIEGIDSKMSVINSRPEQGGEIKGEIPVTFGSGDSTYKIAGDIGKGVKLVTTKENANAVKLGTAAYLVYGDTTKDLIKNGGYKITDKSGAECIYGDYANARGAAANGVVTLLHDYTGNDKINSGSGSGTFDLGGNTYTYTGTDSAIDVNYPKVTLTIQNGKVVATQEGCSGAKLVGAPYQNQMNNRGLVLDSVKLTVSGEAYGIVTNGTETGNSITLKNSTVDVPKGLGIYFPSTGEVTIENSVINAKLSGVQMCAGSLNIRGGKTAITVTGPAEEKTEADGPISDAAAVSIIKRDGYKDLESIVIKDGTFKSADGVDAVKVYRYSADNAEQEWAEADKVVKVQGGSFSTTVPKEYLPSGMIQDESGKVVVNENAVAKIDDTAYATLADAIAVVKDGETITLTKDVPDAEGVVVPSGKNFTLDFAKHTYTLAGAGVGSTNTETNGFQLLQGSTIVFKNGTINYKEGQTKIKRMFQSYADVTFENMNFYTEHQSKAGSQPTAEHYAFSFCNGTIVFTGDTNIISADKNAISFIAGNFQDYPATHVIFDEKFTGSVNSIMEYSGPNTENYSMDIKGNGTFGGLKTTKGDDPDGFNIYSGTFTTVDCLDYLGENANVSIKLDENVNHGIIIPENTTVNLDLNGKTITGDKRNAAVRNEGTLTIEDKSAEKIGVVKREDTEDSASYYVVDNQGTMTITGGTFENNSGKLKDEATQEWTGSSLVRNGGEKEAVLNISGGTFTQDKFIVIKNDDYGTLKMTGGHVVTKNPVASAIQNWAQAEVTGGKIDGMIWTATWSDNLPDATTTLGENVEVAGEIRAGYAGGSGYANKKNSIVIINGGTYDSKFTTQTPTGQEEGKGTKIEVNEGSFTNDTVVPYMTEGNAALYTEGKYFVMPEKDAKAQSVACVVVEGKKVYLTDKADADEVVGDDEKPEIQDTTDYAELEKLVKECEKLDKSLYTADSFAKFEVVLKEANSVLTNKNSTQAEVDALIAKLKDAKEQLVKVDTGSAGGTTDTTDKGNGGNNTTDKKPGAVKTGDTANVVGYMTVMALAAGAVVVAIRRKRRA